MSDKVGQSVLDAVGELLPVLRERAQESEDARQIPAESVKALAEAGFFKLLQPASYGGFEADPVTFYEAVRMIDADAIVFGERLAHSHPDELRGAAGSGCPIKTSVCVLEQFPRPGSLRAVVFSA